MQEVPTLQLHYWLLPQSLSKANIAILVFIRLMMTRFIETGDTGLISRGAVTPMRAGQDAFARGLISLPALLAVADFYFFADY
jgi:hypothetical protein